MPLSMTFPLTASLLLFAGLADCQALTRFTQESYDCTMTAAPLGRIVFTKMSKGAAGVIEGASPDKITITAISDTQIDGEWGGELVQIQRESGRVRFTRDAIVSSYACKAARFRM
ncbi:hypothetical protein [Yoonia sp. TsM2_T14_4]|jgi:hypothetical protein|uniref:hypothetical protein n=1 Tax=Yoonia sp. TsM2_T14_4 TaxID=3415141 RepID=UPI003C730029